MNPDQANSPLTPNILIDVVARVAIIALLTYLCYRVFSPFLPLMMWGLILAIMLYPLHQKLAAMMAGRQGRAATVIVFVGCAALIVPLGLLSASLIDHAQEIQTKLDNGTLRLEPPSPEVADWPIIGERVYNAWNGAAADSEKFVVDYKDQIQSASQKSLASAKGALSSVATFIGALIVAGIMMAWGESGANAMRRILSRFTGADNGPAFQALSVATVRSVATGVLGVAFIQALLFGIGFIILGVPAAGVLALIVLLLGIMQVPAIIVTIPVIVMLWSSGDGSTAGNIAFSVWFFIAGLADNFLKPLLLGRGVDAPMPVILIGALGGMVVGGFIGLFLGATLLAIGYKVFMGWVDHAWSPDFD